MSLARSLMAVRTIRLANLITGASSLDAAIWSMLISSVVSLTASMSAPSSSAFCALSMMSSIEPLLEDSIAASLSITDFSEAIIGAISSFVMRLTSSSANTFSGSAMARNNLLSSRDTGTTLCDRAVSTEIRSKMSSWILTRARLIGGTLSTRPMHTAKSWSLTYAFSMISLTRRVPSFFCCSSSSSTWTGFNRPSSTRASAMRSPNDLTLAMGLTENLAQQDDQFERRHQVPQQPLRRHFRQFLCRLLVERIGGRHQDRLAHAVKRGNAPATAQFRRKTAQQFQVRLILLERQIGHARFVRQELERFFDVENILVVQRLDEGLHDV